MFPLGGLGGLPFTGKTGWGAFSSHCPDNGNIVVLFAPHVGVDANGKVGAISRDGQACGSSACGAAIGAYGAAKGGAINGTFPSGYSDHQMDCIKHLIVPHVDAIKSSDNEMATLAYKMFEIQQEFLEQILNSKWMGKNSKLTLIGGIQINMDGEFTGKFLPLTFEVRNKDGQSRDYYQEVFKTESPLNKF